MTNSYDKLHITAHLFYAAAWSERETKKEVAQRLALDEGGKLLHLKAAVSRYMHEAKKYSWLRRVDSSAYLTRSEDGQKIFMQDFTQIGPRHEHLLDEGWYTDSCYSDTINGVVLAVGRHHEEYTQDYSGEGLFMAGTKHSGCDGVTLYVDTFKSYDDAKRFANARAEYEAEECREEDEKFQREQQIEELKSGIVVARQSCLTLLRDMRPLRKGMSMFPESVCSELQRVVRGYLAEIRGYRNQIGGLA